MLRAPAKDPGYPRRPLSAFVMYSNHANSSFQEDNAHRDLSFGQTQVLIGKAWEEMPQDEKMVWNSKAEEDKKAHEDQVRAYRPPPGYDSNGNLIGGSANVNGSGSGNGSGNGSGAPHSKVRGKKRKSVGSRRRDPFAPKRKRHAYFIFKNEMRDKFRRENPAFTFGQLATFTSEAYRSLTSEEKEAWTAKAEEDKKR